MRVLVATKETQGQRSDDYHHALDGELVEPPTVECHCPECGCRWGMGGVGSHRPTTTFLVADRPDLTWETMVDLLADSYAKGGWGSADDPDLVAIAEESVAEIARVAQHFQVGTVLGRREGRYYVRRAA